MLQVQRDEDHHEVRIKKVTVPFNVQPDTVCHTVGHPEMIDLRNTSLLP